MQSSVVEAHIQEVRVGVVAVCVMEFIPASVGRAAIPEQSTAGGVKTKVATRTIHWYEGFYTKTPKKEIRAWKRSRDF